MKTLRATPEAQFLYAYGCVTTMDIVQLIYRDRAYEGAEPEAVDDQPAQGGVSGAESLAHGAAP